VFRLTIHSHFSAGTSSSPLRSRGGLPSPSPRNPELTREALQREFLTERATALSELSDSAPPTPRSDRSPAHSYRSVQFSATCDVIPISPRGLNIAVPPVQLSPPSTRGDSHVVSGAHRAADRVAADVRSLGCTRLFADERCPRRT
jgi:hypothetical protein